MNTIPTTRLSQHPGYSFHEGTDTLRVYHHSNSAPIATITKGTRGMLERQGVNSWDAMLAVVKEHEESSAAHAPTLTTRLHAPRNGRPIGRIMFRDDCSCGWRGEWLTTAGLAHSAHDWHVRAETTDPELKEQEA